MPHTCTSAVAATLGCFGFVGAAAAQWSHNPAANLGVSTGGSDQNQPKIVPTADGCYIVWLDGIGTGWDTRVQRLNDRGIKQWPGNGTLVADTNYSSTQDYGFAVDAAGNAVIAYRDDNSGATHIEVQKVDAGGAPVWNTSIGGVQVSVTSGGNAPHCCVTTDGSVIAGWSEGSVVKLQRLDANGAPQWTAGGISDTPAAGTYSLSELQPGDNGSVIALYVKGAERHLYAQKFDSAGNKLWNAGSPVIVFNGSAVQFGYFPTFLPDGAGGAVFGYYETGGTRNVYVQRINSAGAEVFPHNGVPVSTNTSIGRLTPWIAFDQAIGDTYCFWTDVSLPVQSQWGLSGQRISSTGARLWGDSALTLLPLSPLQNAFVRVVAPALATFSGAMVFCFDQPGASAHVIATRVDASGAFSWAAPNNFIDACSVNSSKGRLFASLNGIGTRAILAWSDQRSDGGDIYAQSINLDGSLGNPGDVNDDGVVNVDDLLAVITGWGACVGGPPAFCPPDLVPAPVGNDQVNVDDLLTVITNWG